MYQTAPSFEPGEGGGECQAAGSPAHSWWQSLPAALPASSPPAAHPRPKGVSQEFVKQMSTASLLKAKPFYMLPKAMI